MQRCSSEYSFSFLTRSSPVSRLGGQTGCFDTIALRSPPRLLVTSCPLFLNVAKSLLDFFDGVCIAGVLADIVANLDGGSATGGRKLDDDVQGQGLLAIGFVKEII